MLGDKLWSLITSLEKSLSIKMESKPFVVQGSSNIKSRLISSHRTFVKGERVYSSWDNALVLVLKQEMHPR